jgi:hypothetical protein
MLWIVFLGTRKNWEDMGSSNLHRGLLKVATISGSVSALVEQMQTELHSLVTRQEDLRRRIWSIHRALRGLQTMASRPSADRTIARRSGRRQPSGSRYKSSQLSVSLRRACRIALMEADTAVSLEEIYARIMRRGSFSFVNLYRASPALVRVLAAMAEDGEVRLLEAGPSWRWERVTKDV